MPGLGLPALVAAAAVAWLPMPGRVHQPSPHPAGPTPAVARVAGAATGLLASTARFSITTPRTALVTGTPTAATAFGVLDFRRADTELVLRATRGPRTLVVITPAALYVRRPSGAPPLPPRRPWLTTSFADGVLLVRNLPQFVVQAETFNPVLAVSALARGITSASARGRTVLFGQPVTVYDASVDLRLAAARVAGPARVVLAQAYAAQIDALSPAGTSRPATVAARVWVSDGGALVSLATTSPGSGVGRLAISFSGVGNPVRVVPPGDESVVSLAALAPAGERENTNGGDTDGG